MASYPGKIGRKLLISISHEAKRLKCMSQGLRIARLIAHFCLEIAFRRGVILKKTLRDVIEMVVGHVSLKC